MKKLSNNNAGLKESVAYKKACISFSTVMIVWDFQYLFHGLFMAHLGELVHSGKVNQFNQVRQCGFS